MDDRRGGRHNHNKTNLERPMPRTTILAATLLGLAGPAAAGLPAALDGSWYNPDQSGHGITIERVDHDSAVLFWHVFDPSGKPLTLYIDTRIEGDVMKGEVLAPTGMRFGRFEETELALPFWGRVELGFGDCTHATLKYDSPLAGYGRGEIPLTRLLPPASNCSLQAPAGLVDLAGRAANGEIYGEYATVTDAPAAATHYLGELEGFVDDDGGLRLRGDSLAQGDSPSDFVLIGSPRPSAAGSARFEVRAYSNGWLNFMFGASADAFSPPRTDRFPLELKTTRARARGVLLPPELVDAGAPDGEVEVSVGATGEGTLKAGTYPFTINRPGTDLPRGMQLEVAEDLSLCVRPQYTPSGGPLDVPPPACVLTGHAVNGTGAFEFLLEPGDATTPFTGAGQARYCRPAQLFCGFSLRMIGDDGRTGMILQTQSMAP
jgi:hypothetical protein